MSDREHTFEDSIAAMRRLEDQDDRDSEAERLVSRPGPEKLREAATIARRDPDKRLRAVASWLDAAVFGWEALDQHDRHALKVADAILLHQLDAS